MMKCRGPLESVSDYNRMLFKPISGGMDGIDEMDGMVIKNI